MTDRLGTAGVLLLPVGGGLAILGLVLVAIQHLVFNQLLNSAVPLVEVSASAVLGISFLFRAAGFPPSGERNRYFGVGILGILGAVAIWGRNIVYLGPPGRYLWLILLAIYIPVGVLLYWNNLRGDTKPD